MYKKIEKCRICGNTDLERVLDLGEQMLTGVFPREKDAKVTTGPLRLVKFSGQPFMAQTNGKLNLIIADSKADVQVAENLVQDLVEKHQVVAILGDFLVDSSLSIAKKSEKLSVVNMSLSRREGLTDIGDWVFLHGANLAHTLN